MKTFVIALLLILAKGVNAQLYNLIYMKIENGQMIRNMDAEIYAYSFMKSYSGKNISEAVRYLDSIALAGENDYKLMFNKAVCYSILKEEDSTQKYLTAYLQCEGNFSKVPGVIKYSNLAQSIEKNEKLKVLYSQLEDEFCQTVTNCELALKIQFCNFKEQEIMMDTAFNNGKNTAVKYDLMRDNFSFIKDQLNGIGFPNKEEIGASLGLLRVLILHMDYDPKEQLKWAKKMLRQAKKDGSDFGNIIYAIDRSLKNQGKKQKYGSIIYNRGTKESQIYIYRGSLKRLNKRRAKFDLNAISEDESSILINESISK